jgi:CRP/FNR family transcriptional regulator
MTRSGAWIDQFPALSGLDADIRGALAERCALVELAEGAQVFGPGHPPGHYLLVLDGSVKVQQFSEGGRAIVLYRVAAGESCILTTACLVGYENYPAEGVAETPVRAVALPRSLFDELIARSPDFRRFVFTGFGHRITELFRVIDQIAFARMDARLAQKLLALAAAAGAVAMTQQEIATELGTAREVVSRLLAELQRRGWIALTRGQVAILDRAALEQLAARS